MTIVESARPVTGGVDTHLDVHVAAAVDANGGVLGVESFATTPAGYRRAARLAGRVRPGRPGRGGRHRRLRRRAWPPSPRPGSRGDRGRPSEPPGASPGRQVRRRSTRSKRRGRRCRVGRRGSRSPRMATWKRSGRCWSRTARAATCGSSTLNQIRHLGFTAPDELRERFRGVPRDQLGAHRGGVASARSGSDPVTYATKLAIAHAGPSRRRARGRAARSTATRHARAPHRCRACSSSTASGSTPPRSCSSPPATTRPAPLRSRVGASLRRRAAPASSGKTTRHRLNPGGNRQANHALWRIVFTRMSCDERTRTYVARRLAEGRTKTRSCASSSATSPARSTRTSRDYQIWSGGPGPRMP